MFNDNDEMNVKKPEILAPAGDLESLKVAVYNGADAVYFGLPKFNARSKATNISLENLSEAVDFCHLYNVKVYLTVNTLISDDELEQVLDLVRQAYSKGVDAFIIQDLGLAKVLREHIPDIELHASTQMGIHNLEGALIAESLGFKRIVLSREVTINDISLIKAWTNLEIEYFVQGALCVAFSGNCYFSALKYGQSGNRGACIQPCRLKYKSNFGKTEGYLLSTRDLCLIDRLKQLSNLGVDSFKIEGRMRRPAYVAQAVQSYRNAIDCNFNEEVCAFEKSNLKRVFNRGDYNEGIYLDKIQDENIINYEFQNHRGVSIGQVESVRPFKNIYAIIIESKTPINDGDGLKFVNVDGNEVGIGVGGVEQIERNKYQIYSKYAPNVNDIVYKTVDFVRENLLLSNVKKIPITAHFIAKPDEPATLILQYEDCVAKVESLFVCDKALTQSLTYEKLLQNIDRFVDTEFTLTKLTCELNDVFIPNSRINELRRMCVEKLKQIIIKRNSKPIKKLVINSVRKLNVKESNTNNFMIIEDIRDIESVPEDCCLIYAPNNYEFANINNFLIKANEMGHSFVYLNLPNVANSYDIQKIKSLLTEIGNQNIGVVANNIYALCFAKLGYKTIAGYQMNITNCYTADVIINLGAECFVKSIEQDLTKGLKIGHNYVGKPTVMTFCHCPYKTVYNYDSCKECEYSEGLKYQAEDGKNYDIRRIRCNSCYFELVYNQNIGEKVAPYVLDLRGE